MFSSIEKSLFIPKKILNDSAPTDSDIEDVKSIYILCLV